MKYLMLVCKESAESHAPTDADRAAAPDVEQWWNAANDGGHWLTGDPLAPPAEAVTVRVRGGERVVTDGPFTETNELIAGFDVLECESIEQAIDIAAGHPMAYGGLIEIRQMLSFDEN